MSTLFLIFFLLTLWHYLYESFIAPNLRYALKYKFFALRDKLRNTKINGNINSKEESFSYEILDNTLCNSIYSIRFIKISNYFLIHKELKEDEKYRKQFNNARKIIKDIKNKEIASIDNELKKLSTKALLINNGGWAIYLIPLFPVMLLILLCVWIVYKINNYMTLISIMSSRLIYASNRLQTVPTNPSFQNNSFPISQY